MNLHSDKKEHILKKIKKGKHNLPIACMDGGEINQNQLSNYDGCDYFEKIMMIP